MILAGATWSVKTGSSGSLQNSTYTAPSAAGNSVLTCSYSEVGVNVTAELTVTIAASVVFSHITLATGSVTVETGEIYSLEQNQVTAHYNDGTSKVATGATWSLKSGGGTLSNNTFTAGGSAGTAVLTCSFSDLGISKTADLRITVNLAFLPLQET